MSIHFIGVDAGGTRTRALMATETGEVAGGGRSEGANTWSSGTSVATVITAAIREALGRAEPGSVAAGVIAVAGGASMSPEVAADIVAGWRSLGLPGTPDIVLDVLAAYAAGTVEPEGVVLVAGTGSIVAVVRDGQVLRRAGGHGWLLGDEGSSVWLGVQGLRASLRSLDGRGPRTMLATTIPAALDIEAGEVAALGDRIVAAAHGRPPAQLGQLAPVVLEAFEAGDAVARALVEEATHQLVELVGAVVGGGESRAAEPPPVIVLAGSLLTRAAPIRDGVQAGLAERWPGSRLVETASGEAGAVALAISRHLGRPIEAATLARLRAHGLAQHQGRSADPALAS